MDNKFIKALLWILLLFFYIFINILFGDIIKSFNIKNEYILNIVLIVSEIIITGFMIYLYRNDFKDKFKELKSKEGNEMIKSSLRIWIFGLFAMILFNLILSIYIGDVAENEAANRTIISNLSFYAITTMIILTPICEEILFRLSPSKMIDNKYVYIIFSGLLFGYAHVMGTTGLQTLYVLPYASLGFAFAYIYQKYKNIYCNILMHAIHNLMCILIILFI